MTRGEKDMDNIEIAYQNKDITSKVLAEHFKGKTFRVYGLNVPSIRQTLPTNIPAVKANELRLDNLFELADGTLALVDYESTYDKEDKVKYLNYLAGIASRYRNEKKDCPVLRMIVIYTGDIKREQQVFTLAGILAFTDKVIDRETANFIRRAIEMTQVAQIFEEEKQQALKETSKKIVINMIKRNYPSEEIASLVPSYSQDDVDELRMEVAGEKI